MPSVLSTDLIDVRDYADAVVAGDWSPAFAAALVDVTAHGHGGIFVPASHEPYTCTRPAPQTPSIGISHCAGFVLAGEGPGSVIQMMGSDAGGLSWDLIKIFKNSSDITIRDLVLDGNKTAIINPDPGEQTHLLKLGGGFIIASGDPRAGFVRDVRIDNVHFRNALGDGIFLAGAGKFGEGADVTDVTITNCRSTGHGRNGVSVQRCVRRVRILNLSTEGNDNAAIDLEPTGSSEVDAPREFTIMHCTLADENESTRMSLSGLANVRPPRQQTRSVVAFNHVVGKVGAVDLGDCLIAFNVIEHSGTGNAEAALQLRGLVTGVTVAANILTRPVGATPGKILAIEGQGGSFPDGVDVVDNQLVQHTHGQGGDAFIATVQNAKNIRFSRNTFINRYAGLPSVPDHAIDQLTITGHGLLTRRGPCRLLNTGGSLPTGLTAETDYFVIVIDEDTIKLATSPARAAAGDAVAFSDNGSGDHRLDVRITAALSVKVTAQTAEAEAIDLSDNRVVGDAGACSLISGFTVGASNGVAIDSLTMRGNHFTGCTSRYTLTTSGAASFRSPPVVAFAGGESATDDLHQLLSVGAVQIGGNAGGVVCLMGNGTPEEVVTARVGSTYQRVDAAAGSRFFVKQSGSGNSGWAALQTVPD